MPDLRLITSLYEKARRWRRFKVSQSLPVKGLGHGMMTVYQGSAEYFVFALQVSTVNYSTRAESEQDLIDGNYQAFLNNLHQPVQWRFSVRQLDPAQLTEAIRKRMAGVTDDKTRCWLQDQLEHVQGLVQEHNIPQASLYLLVPLRVPGDMGQDDTWTKARKEATAQATRLTNALADLGLSARRLNSFELATLVWSDLNPDLAIIQKCPAPASMVTYGHNMPEGTARVELHHHVLGDDAISVGAQRLSDVIAARDMEFHKDHLELNSMYRCVLGVYNWPGYMQPNALRFLTNSNLNLDIAQHVLPFPSDEALGFLDKRLRELTLSAEKDRLEGYTEDHKVIKFIDQAKYCREYLEQGKGRWFYVAMYVAVTAPSKDQLDQDVKTAIALLNQSGLKAAPLYRQQEQGLYAAMPLALDPIQQNRNMLTDAVANLAPFDCQTWMQPGGFFAGVNRLNSGIVALNLWGLDNYNVCVMGLPGKGKTMWERHVLTHYHNMTDESQVIGDPDGEMDAMVEELGGQVVRLGAGSPHRINLMDLALDFDNNAQDWRKGRPLDKKIDQLAAWLEHYLGTPAGQEGERRLTPLQQARVKHAVVRAYGRYGISPENQADIIRDGRLVEMPLLTDVQDELGATDPDLAEAMDIFRFGTMSIFNARTNVDVSGRLVSLNMRDLDPATRDMAMPWLVNWMWGRVGLNRARKQLTHLYFEEVLAFLSNPIAAEYVSMIWTRGRKWGCSPVAVSQLVFRLLENSVGKTIVQTSDLKVLYDQGDAIDDMTRLCKLSPQEAGFIRGSRPGDGLYVIGPYRVPFSLPLSRYQYEYYTTRPGEMRE